MLRRRRKSRTRAAACVKYTSAKNPAGTRQLCVYAECTFGGKIVGPIWGHSEASVRKVLATLTGACDCGRPFHQHAYTEGRKVVPAKQK